MKRGLSLLLVMLVAGAALYYSNRHEKDAGLNANAVVNLAAETQRELSRVPMEATRISNEEEIEIGNRMAARYEHRESPSSENDAAMQQYVSDVGANVVGGSLAATQIVGLRTRRHLVYHFHYIPDIGLVNAFALPGGHVFIGTGLIALMHSEDELAMILGHEVEHIDRFHCAERVQIEARLRHIPLSGIVGLPIELFQAGYNKDQELEADREGTLLAAQAKYSAGSAIEMFDEFDKRTRTADGRRGNPLEQVPKVALQGLAGYFRSHPYPSERKQQIQAMIDSGRVKAGAERALRVSVSLPIPDKGQQTK
jgi:predicted Zn-dependent protease